MELIPTSYHTNFYYYFKNNNNISNRKFDTTFYVIFFGIPFETSSTNPKISVYWTLFSII